MQGTCAACLKLELFMGSVKRDGSCAVHRTPVQFYLVHSRVLYWCVLFCGCRKEGKQNTFAKSRNLSVHSPCHSKSFGFAKTDTNFTSESKPATSVSLQCSCQMCTRLPTGPNQHQGYPIASLSFRQQAGWTGHGLMQGGESTDFIRFHTIPECDLNP